MTTKAYKRMCRHKVEFYAKLITFVLVLIVGTCIKFFALNEYWAVFLIPTLWFYGSDVAAYLLEAKYHIKHIKGIYR